jgi:hypothetical protein
MRKVSRCFFQGRWTCTPLVDTEVASGGASVRRMKATSRLHSSKMQWKLRAGPSFRSKRRRVVFLHRLSVPKCRTSERTSGSRAGCSSWFLLCAVQTRVYDPVAQKTQSGGDLDQRFGRVSQVFQHQRLTRSIHRSYTVKSSVGIAYSGARGGVQNAHRGTGKNSTYLEVLVRIRWSWFSCKEESSLQTPYIIPP